MATWTPKGHPARRKSLKRWRAKNRPIKPIRPKPKPVKPLEQYWPERRLMNLIRAGIVIPEIEEEK